MQRIKTVAGTVFIILGFLAVIGLVAMRITSFGMGNTDFAEEQESIDDDVVISQTEETQTAEPEETAEAAGEEEQVQKEYVLSFIGDCTLAPSQYNNDFLNKVNGDYSYPFKNTVQYFTADDLTIANLECTFSDRTMSSSSTFAFKSPTSYAQILPAGGVDFVTTANNHRDDYADNGRVDTDNALDAVGIPHASDNETYIYELDGRKIGIYCCYNRLVPTIDLVTAGVNKLKESGAEYIICALHWGVEGSYHMTTNQIVAAHAAIDAGADVVYGTHPHVLQQIEEYGDGVILYSMGNWSFGGNTAPRDRDTAIVQITVREDEEGNLVTAAYSAIPCCLSSTAGVNDYCPIPYEEGTEEYERTLSKLAGTFEGDDLVVDYSGIGQ